MKSRGLRIAAVLAAATLIMSDAKAAQLGLTPLARIVSTGVTGLSPEVMGLKTEIYDPRVHYHQVRDKWIGVRTPDGR